MERDSFPQTPVGRRAALGLLGAAGVASTWALSPANAAEAAESKPIRNLRDFGAVGDGRHDDTAALVAALTSAGPFMLYAPAGDYLVRNFPVVDAATWPADLHSVIVGDGPWLTNFVSDTPGPMFEFRNVQRLKFERIGFVVHHPAATATIVRHCFHMSYYSCRFQGDLQPATQDTYKDQTGVVLTDNSGTTDFVNTEINNFGVGLNTLCIQNYFAAGKFSANRIAILGTGNNGNAGLAVTMTDFGGYRESPTTADAAIRVAGKANEWWINQCWFEQSNYGLDIGDDTGGPVSFGVFNCKINARKTVVRIRAAQNTTMAANSLFGDLPETVPMEVDPVHAALGTFSGGLVWTGRAEGEQVPISVLPPSWQVDNRHYSRHPVQVADRTVTRGEDGRYWQLIVDRFGFVRAHHVDLNSFGQRLPE